MDEAGLGKCEGEDELALLGEDPIEGLRGTIRWASAWNSLGTMEASSVLLSYV